MRIVLSGASIVIPSLPKKLHLVSLATHQLYSITRLSNANFLAMRQLCSTIIRILVKAVQMESTLIQLGKIAEHALRVIVLLVT